MSGQLNLERFCVAMRLVSIGQNTQYPMTQESLFVTKDQILPLPNLTGTEHINTNEPTINQDKFSALNSIVGIHSKLRLDLVVTYGTEHQICRLK